MQVSPMCSWDRFPPSLLNKNNITCEGGIPVCLSALTLIPWNRDRALRGRSARSVRIVLKACMFPPPISEAIRLITETYNVKLQFKNIVSVGKTNSQERGIFSVYQAENTNRQKEECYYI